MPVTRTKITPQRKRLVFSRAVIPGSGTGASATPAGGDQRNLPRVRGERRLLQGKASCRIARLGKLKSLAKRSPGFKCSARIFSKSRYTARLSPQFSHSNQVRNPRALLPDYALFYRVHRRGS